jgi:hypothetical protein
MVLWVQPPTVLDGVVLKIYNHDDNKINILSIQQDFKQDIPKTTQIKTNKKLQEHLICISYHLHSTEIIIRDDLLQIPCTWINCNPGLMSMITTSMPEDNDIITMIDRWYTVQEPIHIDSFTNSLHPNSYIRIFDKPIATLFSQLQRDSWIAYLSGSQLQSHFTVLATVSCSDEVSGALAHCSHGSENIFEYYVRSHIGTSLSPEVISSIQRTWHIIIIIDHKATEQLWSFCDTLIKSHCGRGVTIQYIFPQFHLVSSILADYLYEEACFDQPAFESYISESIEAYNHGQS